MQFDKMVDFSGIHNAPIPAVAINAVSILLDVMVIAIYFPGNDRFSVGMAILNLIIRPFTTIGLYRMYVERVNAIGGTVPNLFGVVAAQRSPYEDIDNVHQSVPRSEIPSPSQFSPSGKMPPPYHT
ncbi:hypothetical protein C0J52_05086 [Blattella germanica]|nr:hypothetical protein C0J52_05086 [Blattella germanica]